MNSWPATNITAAKAAMVAAGMGLATLRHRAGSARLQALVGVAILLLGIADVTMTGAAFPE
jgi:hypothetical protein